MLYPAFISLVYAQKLVAMALGASPSPFITLQTPLSLFSESANKIGPERGRKDLVKKFRIGHNIWPPQVS
jgi:hypothetical protein